MRAKLVYDLFEFKRGENPYDAIGVGKVHEWKERLGEQGYILDIEDRLKRTKFYINREILIMETFFDQRWLFDVRNVEKTELIPDYNDFIDYLNLDYKYLAKYSIKKLNKIIELKLFIKDPKNIINFFDKLISAGGKSDYIGNMTKAKLEELASIVGEDKVIEWAKYFGPATMYKVGRELGIKELEQKYEDPSITKHMKTYNVGYGGKHYSTYTKSWMMYNILKHIAKYNQGLRYTDIVKFAVQFRYGGKIDYTRKDFRGYWSDGIKFYRNSGYIRKDDNNGRWYITNLGRHRLEELNKKFEE